MSLKIIYGRAKSKKGETVFSEAVKTGGLVIVPETFTLLSEQKMSKLAGTLGLSGPEVLSFERLAHSFADYGPLGRESIDPSGKTIALSIIIEKLKKELNILKSDHQHSGLSQSLLTLIGEFKRYLISPEIISRAADMSEQKILSEKLKDISLIFQKYNEFIESGYTDKDDDLSGLLTYLKENKPLSGRDIYIDRFSYFTPLEHAIIKELVSQCKSVTVTLPCTPDSFEFQFLSSVNTADKLKKSAEDSGVAFEETVFNSVYENDELFHLEQNFFAFEEKPYNKEPSSISLFSAKSLNSEVEEVARKIRALVKDEGLRYKDITVLVRDTALYSSTIKNIFSSFDIPVTDTESISSSLHPLSVYLTSAIEASVSGFSKDPLFRFLKSGFSPFNKESVDKLENYMLAAGIHGSALSDEEKWRYRKTVFSDYEISEKEETMFTEIDEIRKAVLPPLSKLKDSLKGRLTALDFCRAVYGFMEDINLPEKVTSLFDKYTEKGQNDDAARLISVYNAILSAMDSLIAASCDNTFSAKKFNDIFADGIAATTMKIIPSSADCVNFINAARGKGLSSPVVFIMGLNDHVFPKAPENNGLLSDSDRRYLKDLKIELAPDNEYLNYEELTLLYSALTCASKKLYLSYALHDEGGKTIFPSSVISKIKTVFPKIKEDGDIISLSPERLISAPSPTLTHMLDNLNRKALGEDIDDKWLMVYDWFINNKKELLPKIPNSLYSMRKTVPLNSEITESLFPDGVTTGVSRLEAYSSCPFKYYMQYILKAEKRKIAEFTPADTGSILHRYIDSVSRYIEDNSTSWTNITENELKTVASGVTNEIIENSSYFVKNSNRALYLIKRLQNLSVKMLTVIKKHFESGEFIPLGSELVFGYNGDYPKIKLETTEGTVHLTGKIDRADVLHTDRGDFIRIVDYKSGNKTFSFSEIYHGLSLQLSVYMLALNENTNSNPAAMLYFKLDDPIDKTEASSVSEDYEKSVKMNGLILEDEEILSAMDKSTLSKSNIYGGDYATLENFDAIFSHVKRTIGKIHSEMKKGNFSVSPKSVSDNSPCTYCDYKKVCAGGEGCSYLSKIDKKNPWPSFCESDNSNSGGENS